MMACINAWELCRGLEVDISEILYRLIKKFMAWL
jgi:hypothetical protein